MVKLCTFYIHIIILLSWMTHVHATNVYKVYESLCTRMTKVKGENAIKSSRKIDKSVKRVCLTMKITRTRLPTIDTTMTESFVASQLPDDDDSCIFFVCSFSEGIISIKIREKSLFVRQWKTSWKPRWTADRYTLLLFMTITIACQSRSSMQHEIFVDVFTWLSTLCSLCYMQTQHSISLEI